MNNIYTLTVKREFKAEHFLIGGDWGHENQQHAHLYGLEAEIAGVDLDRHGFLIDIVELDAYLDGLVKEFTGQVLNEAPAFKGSNPSLERFCLIVHDRLAHRLKRSNIKTLTVRLAEDKLAVASYKAEL